MYCTAKPQSPKRQSGVNANIAGGRAARLPVMLVDSNPGPALQYAWALDIRRTRLFENSNPYARP